MLNGSKSPEKLAAENSLRFVTDLVQNFKARLDNPIAPVLEAAMRHRVTIDMLSGAAMALTCAGHPLAKVIVSITNQASQVGERAMDDAVEYMTRLVKETK